MALFSIITTCFNASGCIAKTIRSVLSQDYRDFEYIIMDGGSEDGTLEIAGKFTDDFAKAGISYSIFCEKDHGIYEGMNHGIRHAKGRFINLLNADDCLYDANTLSKVASVVSKALAEQENAPGIFYGDAVAIEFGQSYHYVKDLSLIERRMPFSHQSVFAARELLDRFPFREEFRIGADYDFLLSAYRADCTFFDLNLPVCIVTLDGLSSLDLLHTFTETVEIQKDHGIVLYSDKAYARKRRMYVIKQFVMDHFPKWCIHAIRKVQRISRGQNEHC
ncbi:MAG: glycosyltransferase [Lachnospiraceae bacterium]|nr:glycosyltransferase [Lachnospiraceae bacterium]